MRHAKAEIAKSFAREAELEEKCKRLAEPNAELNMDKRENEIVDGAEEQSEEERDENSRTRSDRTDRKRSDRTMEIRRAGNRLCSVALHNNCGVNV